jgi:hypothetical protein
VSDRTLGFTRARTAWRKIVESMNADQLHDLLTSDEAVSWLRTVVPRLLETSKSVPPLTRDEILDHLATVLVESRGEPQRRGKR